jgi:hypothetical protein
MHALSRRRLLRGGAAVAAGAALPRLAHATPGSNSAVVIAFLYGGYNALFGSAKSFLTQGTFGTSSQTVRALGPDLSVDATTFGDAALFPTAALSRMATVGVNHQLSAHTPAQRALFAVGNERSAPLVLANLMQPAPATLPCVLLGGAPPGTHPPEGAISLQRVSDMTPTLELFGARAPGQSPAPNLTRTASVAALDSARRLSQARLTANPNSLRSLSEGYESALAVMGGAATAPLDFDAIATAYAVTGRALTTFAHQMAAAEAMIGLGSRVIITSDTGWDTHNDRDGSLVRQRMRQRILPGLKTFVERMVLSGTRNVTVCLMGDFARSLPGSDHASCLAATVIGTRVLQGSTGVMNGAVGLPPGAPGVDGLWAYLAACAQAPAGEFNANPHTGLVMP